MIETVGLVLGWFYFRTSLPVFEKEVFAQSKTLPAEHSTAVKQFGLVIDKIGVEVPIVSNVDGDNKLVYLRALKKGVAHYRGTAFPGGGTNIFIFGHSSMTTGSGPYAEVFARLPELTPGDEITVYYQAQELKYKVAKKKIIEKTDVDVLDPTPKEQLTIMTCWPIGSNEKRIIIIANPV